MHVAVLGAGALGRAFGVRLAALGKVDVDFVVRASQLDAGAIEIERVGGDRLRLETPSYMPLVPPHADAVIVCVRADQLGDELFSMLQRGPAVPVVMMTPMLPKTYARVRGALAGRLVAAMSSVTGYTNAAGVTRHWVPRTGRTLLEEPRPADPTLTALVAALGSAGINAGFELALHETSAATAISVLPLFMGIDAAGSIDALLEDDPLLKTTFQAMKEARALAERCGKVAQWVRALERFAGPVTARVGLALGRRRSPEIISFVEEHFGRRAHPQNLVMGAEIVAFADEKEAPHESLRALAARTSSLGAW